MNSSVSAAKLIAYFEGFRAKAYLDPVGIPTIGYGSTHINGVPVVLGQTITRDAAIDALSKHINSIVPQILKAVEPTAIQQNHLDALCAFVYNLGIGTFIKSSLLQKIKSNPADPSIEASFLAYNKARLPVKDAAGHPVLGSDGKPTFALQELGGLTRRRAAEAKLYFTGETPSLT